MSISAFLLDPQTSHSAVEEHVGRRWTELQRGEYELSVGLRRLFRDNVHRGAGIANFKSYAAHRFDMPGKLAELFSFIGKNLERLPKTRAAFEAGELSYTKIREFVKIASPEDEADWIGYAKTHTNRQLERKAERAKRGSKHDTKKVVSRLDPEEVQAARAVREMLMKKLDEPVPPDKLLPKLAKAVLDGGLFDGNGKVPEAPRPHLAMHLCPKCIYTWVPTAGENMRLPIEAWLEELKRGTKPIDFLKDLLCDCEGEKHRRDLCPEWKPTTGEAPKSRHIPVEVWRRVQARDGFRCRTPGCLNEVPLEGGHLKPFRDGAPMLPPFLCQQCATCNDLIETGRLVVEGEAPFERYYLADGTFLGCGFDPTPANGSAPHVGSSREPPVGKAGGPKTGRKTRF